MRIVRIREFGGSDVLAFDEVPVPEPGAGEVLVHVHAASINPVDYKMRQGEDGAAAPDSVRLGRDIAGVVCGWGSGVTGFMPGDHIYAMLPFDRGGYAEYVTIDAALCAPKPRSVDDVHAAAVPLAALTAWQGLFDHGCLQPGQHVLIHGGTGGVGHFALQMARAVGATVSTTVPAEDLKFARTLGADQVVDYKTERFENAVHDADLVLDLVGGDTQERSWDVVRPGGALISTLSPPSQDKARRRHVRAESYMVQPNVAELREISAWIDRGAICPAVDGTLPFERVDKGQDILEKGHVRGKLVLRIS